MSDRQKSILVVSRSAQLMGGIETQLIQLAQLFEIESQPATFWFGSQDLKKRFKRFKYSRVELDNLSFSLDNKLNTFLFILVYYFKQDEYRAKLAKLADNSEKIIHIHSLAEQLLLTSLAKELGFKVVWTIHNSFHLNRNFVLGYLMRKKMLQADEVISVSQSVYNTIKDIPAQHKVIHNGVKVEAKLVRKDDGKVNIGFIGRMHKDKNFDYFIHLIKFLSPAVKQKISANIAGDGPMKVKFAKILEKKPFNYLGFLDSTRLVELYSRLDILIMPSGDFEGLP